MLTDVVELVFEYLDVSDLQACSKVSKDWSQLTTKFIYRSYTLCKQRKPISKHVRQLKVDGKRLQPGFILHQIVRMRYLRHLSISDMMLPRNFIRKVASRCPFITHVTIQRVDITDTCLYAMRKWSLVELQLLECHHITDGGLRIFEASSIKSMALSGHALTPHVLHHLPDLVSLHVERLGHIKKSHIVALPEYLRKLDLIGSSISKSTLRLLLDKCTHLCGLTIVRGLEWQPMGPIGYTRRKSFTEEEVQQYLETFPCLEEIKQE